MSDVREFLEGKANLADVGYEVMTSQDFNEMAPDEILDWIVSQPDSFNASAMVDAFIALENKVGYEKLNDMYIEWGVSNFPLGGYKELVERLGQKVPTIAPFVVNNGGDAITPEPAEAARKPWKVRDIEKMADTYL